jgi:hypothetical protein
MRTNVTLGVDGKRWWLVVVAAVTFCCTVAAHAEVYRCTTNGNVTYRDAPCDRPSAPPLLQQAPPETAVPPVPVAGKPDFYGGWSGQAQYQATVNSRPVDEAHAVVDLVLIIDPKGKVTGASRENGCNALGFATPGLGPTLNLDVTLTGCRYSGFNRRFTGTFGLPPGRDYATVSLLAYEARGVPSGMYEIKATMRR